jgi:uncharacterized protein DUF4886
VALEPAARPSRRRRLTLLLLAALVVVAGGVGGGLIVYSKAGANPGCEEPPARSSCVRVLFLGNSFTAVNDLPYTFSALAWSGGHGVETGMRAPGGWTLVDHSTSPDTPAALAASRWDYVVLQEQSQIPSVEYQRQTLMYPAARDLVRMARSAGAAPIFFLTWAHRDGWPENGLNSYSSMQAAVDDAYRFIAREQHAAVAPVGVAWAGVVAGESSPDLWQGDDVHPTTKGTYLAACVFYAVVFRQTPVGLGFHPWLSGSDAAQVQAAAAAVVLGDPEQWGLD